VIDTPTTSLRTTIAWPEGVTARLVTRMGLLLNDPTAVVVLSEQHHEGLYTPADHNAVCIPCGWTTSNSDHNKTVEASQAHADGCTGLPNPNHT